MKAALTLRGMDYLIREKADSEGCVETGGYCSGKCNLYVPLSNSKNRILKQELYLHDTEIDMIFHIKYHESELRKIQNAEGGPAMVITEGCAEIWISDGGRIPALRRLIEA